MFLVFLMKLLFLYLERSPVVQVVLENIWAVTLVGTGLETARQGTGRTNVIDVEREFTQRGAVTTALKSLGNPKMSNLHMVSIMQVFICSDNFLHAYDNYKL